MSYVPPPTPGSAASLPAAPPPQIIVQQQAPTALGRYGRFLIIALVIAIMTIIGQNASYRRYFSTPGEPQEKYHSLNKDAKDKVAVIRVEGPIYQPDGYIKKQIDKVRQDEDVVAVVLRIDSPGGTVTASDCLYHELVELKKDRKLPIVVSMGSLCASGGYYMAMAAGPDSAAGANASEPWIYAEPSTWTGSIGVLIPHYDLSGLLADWNVVDDSVASHPEKLTGSPTRALSPEERAEERKILQELIDESFKTFKDIVGNARPALKADAKAFDKATTGRIFSAKDAEELELVDEIGFLDSAIEQAAKLAGRKASEVRCVQYDDPSLSLGSLLGIESQTPPAASFDLAKALQLTAPRMFYMSPAWLPSSLSPSR